MNLYNGIHLQDCINNSPDCCSVDAETAYNGHSTCAGIFTCIAGTFGFGVRSPRYVSASKMDGRLPSLLASSACARKMNVEYGSNVSVFKESCVFQELLSPLSPLEKNWFRVWKIYVNMKKGLRSELGSTFSDIVNESSQEPKYERSSWFMTSFVHQQLKMKYSTLPLSPLSQGLRGR